MAANVSQATFSYDPLGRRTDRNFQGVNTNYLYDGVNPVQELNGSAVTANLLTGGVDEYFTRTDSTGTSNFLTDALGSTEELTDSSGNSQVQYSYAPYGAISISGTTSNSYTYTGREIDGLGLDFYRARYYNPQTGRFLSEDPIGLAGGINQYLYVGDDPMDFIDPLGMDKKPPNNPPVPNNPPTPDNCLAQVRNDEEIAHRVIEVAGGVTVENLVVGCAFAGPLIFECEAGVAAVALVNTAVIMTAEYYGNKQKEAACYQHP